MSAASVGFFSSFVPECPPKVSPGFSSPALNNRIVMLVSRLFGSTHFKVTFFVYSLFLMGHALHDFIQKIRAGGVFDAVAAGMISVGAVSRVFCNAARNRWLVLGFLKTPFALISDIGFGISAMRSLRQEISASKGTSCGEATVSYLQMAVTISCLAISLFSIGALLFSQPSLLLFCDVLWIVLPLFGSLLEVTACVVSGISPLLVRIDLFITYLASRLE